MYVELVHVVPMYVDPDAYGLEHHEVDKLAQAMADDPDLMDEFGNGPHDVVDLWWTVVTDQDQIQRLHDAHVFHTVRAEVKRHHHE